jgi:single-strand DNA-binding protein
MIPTTERDTNALNSVTLRGRISAAPLERELPSGDKIVTTRLVMARDPDRVGSRSRQVSDWVDCVAWSARARRSALSWKVGDIVEIEGALRRRFFRAEAANGSRVEVEVMSGRRVERST